MRTVNFSKNLYRNEFAQIVQQFAQKTEQTIFFMYLICPNKRIISHLDQSLLAQHLPNVD